MCDILSTDMINTRLFHPEGVSLDSFRLAVRTVSYVIIETNG